MSRKKQPIKTVAIAEEQKTLSPGKRMFFAVAVFLVPFAVLTALELSLRLFDYGGNQSLVVQKNVAGKEYYVINRSAAVRYFGNSGVTVPEPAEDIFEIVKSSNTKRIFCLGESTMAGFPYDFNATAPSFLRDRLQTMFPRDKIEVINIGLSAISSYVVLDFIKELLHYQPDLFILYLGHNEFYGIYGVGSTQQAVGGRWLTQTTIKLLDYKVFLLIRNFIGWLRQTIRPNNQPSDATLMEQMVHEQYIPYQSELYRKAREQYENNLREIIQASQANHVPLLFGTLVSNFKDHPPFRSVFNNVTSSEGKRLWQEAFDVGIKSLENNDFTNAEKTFNQCIAIDSLQAIAYYKLGLIRYEQGKYEEATLFFTKAKDLDALRFRATEEFQNILVRTCSTLGVPIARIDSAFEAQSPHAIIGRELMTEHLHPNFKGYFLMAKVFAEAMREKRLLFPENAWDQALQKTDEEYYRNSEVTEFDELVGSIKIDLLQHKWPFTEPRVKHRFIPHSKPEEIAFRYVQGKVFWSEARYELSEHYAASKDFNRARRECLAVSKVIPYSYQPLLRIADYFRMEGQRDSAKAWYQQCIAAEDNPYARMKLAIILLEEEQPSQAAQQIEAGFQVAAQKGAQLSTEASASSYYLLGVAYAKMGNMKEARENLQHSLSIIPNQPDTRELLQQIERLSARR